jgi:hypothetical protein
MRRNARNAVKMSGALALIALALAAFGASSASAIGITNWEAGTCSGEKCSYAGAPSEFFPQAAGHPQFGATDFTVGVENEDQVKRVKVELPPGLNVNPEAVPRCPVETFTNNDADCGALGSEVGVSQVTSKVLGFPIGPLSFPVYNLQPDNGEPALFGFHVKLTPELLGIPLAEVISEFVYLKTSIDWAGDYHESFYIENIQAFPPLARNRLVFNGRAGGFPGGGGSFLTLPSACNAESSSFLELESQAGATTPNTKTTPPVPVANCGAVPFAPTVAASASGPTDSSSTINVALGVPQHLNGEEIASSTVKSANVTLPAGVGLNPATAPGLKFCPDGAFPLHSTAPVTCSPETQIGTVAIEAPELPAGSLTGPVYLAEQKSREPLSGSMYRVFFNAESTKYGVQVREEGKVRANPTTGQLSAEFNELPQVGFSSATLTFGSTAKHAIPVLSSPPICTSTATSTAVPYSTGATTTTAPTTLTMTQAPGGQPCAKTLAERPFTPAVSASPVSSKAATYTPFQLKITRNEGQQEIKGFNLTLPPGATANISGIPYCEANEFGRAVARTGVEEEKSSSCKGPSEIGTAQIEAGTGNTPLKINGKVFLSGPYNGAPLSAVVITPAVAGPFDLGNVVVHAPLNFNGETGVISTSAEIPDVFGGAKLDIRSILVNLNRSKFTLNGTNCSKFATTGTVSGGGGDPANSSAWSQAQVNTPFQAEGCDGLDFNPGLKVQLFGATKRAKHPKLTATLNTTEGQANTQLASVGLPHAIFLDQASLGTVCTRPQFAAGQCPAKSVYGYAKAWTPLLSQPVQGPVYLRSSNNTLPDMVADLKGQVSIVLDGKIDSFKGGIRTTFGSIPDLPVSKFEITLPGGKHGLLINSTNLCAKPVRGVVRLEGQNGKKVVRHPRLQRSCNGKHPKKKHHKKKGKAHKGKKGKHAGKKGKKQAGKHKGGKKKPSTHS